MVVPLTPEQVEQTLEELKSQIAGLDDRRMQEPWEAVLVFLEARLRALGQERAGVQQAIERIRRELAE